jgi:ATP-dependent RNA helicase SUPV3L1/SUV3
VKHQPTENWGEALALTGETLRAGAREADQPKEQTVARSYRVQEAAKRLKLKRDSIEEAVILDLLPSFLDPEGVVRIPARAIEDTLTDSHLYEQIAGVESVSVHDIVAVTDLNPNTLRRKLQRAGLDRRTPIWNDIRGQWGLPQTYPDFQALLGKAENKRLAQVEYEREQRRRQVEEEKRRRADLQSRLLELFPEWGRDERKSQEVILHVGPPNSGKTHDALNALAQAGSGWYLAPLRLLAYEAFDRLNRRGILCNLLTGEEQINVPGAQVTAATIEMFNSERSGECVVIDEAQMLADADRGWAWTRAMMDATSPQIHMIASKIAQNLVEQMAKAASLPLRLVEHERLTPIRVAENPYKLDQLPPQTILVAFSRRTVLELKNELENHGRRVSVVYGSLPPEVRRKQSDRFASRETEICVATDAVGMGLNLPADHVVFYEIEKFDGRAIRKLEPIEVQQIGGRAGRYGFSEYGEVGALDRLDHRFVRQMFHKDATVLTHARIAPTLQDLEVIPGPLAQKLLEWSQLRSIPKELKSIIKIAEMEERIILAQMLTDKEVETIGLAAAVRLINAPTREASRWYWRRCAKSIIDGDPMPLPPEPPESISNTRDLDLIESSVNYADIYLWLGHRYEFEAFAPDLDIVRDERRDWSEQIDNALLEKIKNVRVCSNCGRVLPVGYKYGLCQNCFKDRRNGNNN